MRSEGARSLAIEAAGLLRRLHEITGELGTGFDLPTAAESALDELEVLVDADRMALYSWYLGTRPVTVAVRGAERAPWPAPDQPGTVLNDAWRVGDNHVGEPFFHAAAGANGRTFVIEQDGRVVAAQPIVSLDGERIGLLVADRDASRPFEAGELETVAGVVHAYGPFLDTGMLFSWLRARSGAEDRARLANQIHNGIAQELVALGFQVDTLRLGKPGTDPRLRAQLDVLRTVISQMVADMRLRIAELRIHARPDGSVGALLVARMQVVGAWTGLSVRSTLREAGSRLPANVEALVYRLALDVIADATRSAGATRIDLDLEVTPPSVRMRIAHDGATTTMTLAQFGEHPLAALGALITYVAPAPGLGPEVSLAYDGVSEVGGAASAAAGVVAR